MLQKKGTDKSLMGSRNERAITSIEKNYQKLYRKDTTYKQYSVKHKDDVLKIILEE